MARAMHRFRHIRLTTGRQIRAENRVENRPRKQNERDRRDVRMAASIKARGMAKDSMSPAERSWVTAKLDKQWRQVTADDLKALVA